MNDIKYIIMPATVTALDCPAGLWRKYSFHSCGKRSKQYQWLSRALIHAFEHRKLHSCRRSSRGSPCRIHRIPRKRWPGGMFSFFVGCLLPAWPRSRARSSI